MTNYWQALGRKMIELTRIFTRPVVVNNLSTINLNPFWLGTIGLLLGELIASADFQMKKGPVAFYPPEVFIYALFVIAWATQRGRNQLKNSWWALDQQIRLAIGLIILGAIIATICSPIFPASLGALKAWFVAPLLLFWLIISFCRSTSQLMMSILALSGVLLARSGYEILQPGATIRLTAFYESPNYLAALLAPITVLVFASAFSKNKNWLMLALMLLAVTGLTKSLGALSGIALAAVFAWFYLGRVAKVAIVLGLVALAVALQPIVKERLSHPQNSLTSRVQLWEAGTLMGATWPITGAGLRGYEVHFPEFITKVTDAPQQWDAAQPHNLYLAWWVNFGLIGLIGLVVLLVRLLRLTGRPSPFQLAIIVLLGHGLVDTPYFRVDLALMFWLYVASVVVEQRSLQKERQVNEL